MTPQICVAGLCGNGSRLESSATPRRANTTGRIKSPTGVLGLETVIQRDPAAKSQAARRYQSNSLDNGMEGSVVERQIRYRLCAISPAVTKPIIVMPRTPDRNQSRLTSHISATP
ncbi:MAG TPA: hypothetical protein DD662_04280 [Planctomycetaceae bacterium]|nr:hypothetical protein [Planctomycetaceae bacterium]